MTLEEEVKYLIIKHDYSKGGVDTLVPEVIGLVLDKAIDAYQYEANMHGIPYEAFDAIQKAIEKLKAIS